ncbi:ComEA family DNA-binding protein [Halomonas mongoliensis]|uniref:ComEA family DNA-binding protein n=1 Tax=Halomonas mongoliensis TaxID=321265 RepID=UPI00403B0B2C
MKGTTRSALAAALLALLLGIAPLGAMAQDVAPINVNTADAELLTELPGVGPARAAAIIEEREANGPFESAEDLTRVSGIGEATAASLEDQITF